ncbi:MAG: Trm112 family protein [Pirellulales bacterium]|nr:Trm112 family protein [Pirellulales bacterium]
MIDKQLLDLLVCPENQTPLAVADEALLARLNHAIGRGLVKNRAGQRVNDTIKEGLVREDRTLLYPVMDGIPVMLVDEAIPLDQVE